MYSSREHLHRKHYNFSSFFSSPSSAPESGDHSSHTVYRMLGYFSIVGLLRMHCLLGDYWLALKTLEPIDLTKKGLFSRVTACQITLYYYLGFAYLMMRRYVDAIKTFSSILLYISRTKQYHTRSYQYESVSESLPVHSLLVSHEVIRS
jgi:translation initiation factor 3 subunit L